MSLVIDWTRRLAEEVAPDEVDLAPFMAEAFVASGRTRDDLYARGETTTGGFIAGEVIAVVPLLLKTLSDNVPGLIAVLSSKLIGDFLGCVKNGMALTELKMETDLHHKQSTPVQPAPAQTSPAEASIPANNLYAPLRLVIASMSKELQDSSLSPEASDAIIFRVLKTLLEDPEGSTRYIQALSGKR